MGEHAIEKVALIGEHISHSRSPAFHNALFERHGLPLRYELMPLAANELAGAIARMKEGGYRGANVTSPHKERIVALLDELSSEARRLGAVNTILFENGRAIGYNTDGAGFARTLRDEPLRAGPHTAAVLGAGGAAASAVDVLLASPHLASLIIYSRTLERAFSLAARFSDDRLAPSTLDRFAPADLVVHATPVGMAAHPGALLNAEQLHGVGLLYEMIYAPEETELMRRARSAGARIVNGEGMLRAQAEESFRIWVDSDSNERQ
jgi:shikimate dehydrogenase